MSPFEEVLEVLEYGPSCSSSTSTEYSLAGYSTKYSVKRNMSM